MSSSLPAAPSLQQLRTLAKELLRDHRDGLSEALARVANHHPSPGSVLQLADAQLVVAREHGFASWPRLKSYVERVTAQGADLRHPIQADAAYFEDRATGLLSAHQSGVAEATEVFRRHLPGRSLATLTIDDARLAMARQHGFAAWEPFIRHLRSLRGGEDEPFMRAVGAVEDDDGQALEALIGRYPGLVAARGTNGNTLLSVATGTCRVALVRLLLDLGADPASASDRGRTPLHQAAYMNHEELTRLLLEAGAPTDRSGHGDGGTPLVVALFWGHREAAELIAARDLSPGNLRVAAGLGRRDLTDDLVGADGRLDPRAGAHRGFYRPHTGFPLWRPSADRQEILDEALVWACRSGRLDVLAPLVERGARVDADPYRGTPLAWSAVKGRRRTVEWLLDHGADVNRLATFGSPDHGYGVTALHLAAQRGDAEIARLLLDRGADPLIEDGLHHGTPLGWARHFGREAVAGMLGPPPSA